MYLGKALLVTEKQTAQLVSLDILLSTRQLCRQVPAIYTPMRAITNPMGV
jgi:hypothetical protein